VSSPSLLVTAAVPNAIIGILHWLEDDFRTTSGILEPDMMLMNDDDATLFCFVFCFAIAPLSLYIKARK
jgi:hypothetical protein